MKPRTKTRQRLTWASLCVFFALLALPFGVEVTGLDANTSAAENRVPAPAPVWPNGWMDLLALPRRTDAWLRDHFGFRATLVRVNAELRYALFQDASTGQVLFGKGNRLFLSGRDESHPYSIIAYLCGIHVSAATVDAAAVGIRTLLRAADPDAPASLFVVVPSAPILYAEDLPDWLSRQCGRPTTIERIVQQVDADPALAARVIYPIDTLVAAKQTGRVIPLYNFHWSGWGASVTAAMLAENVLGLHRFINIPVAEQMAASDLSNMVPGLILNDVVIVPDYAAANLVYCYARPECLPELGAPIATVIGDYSRTLSPRAGSRRLLLLTDSYGAFVAPWFAAWFGEVRHISTNAIGRLSAADRAGLREFLFRRYRPDNVIFLYHDSAMKDAPEQVAALLWPTPAVASAR